MDVTDLDRSAQEASRLLAALGSEHRLQILCHLVKGEMRVGQLQAVTGLGQSALSQHLARLRRDGIVRTRRESQAIYYSLDSPEARRLIETLYELYCAEA